MAACPVVAQENIKVKGMGLFSDMRLKSRLSFLHGFSKKEVVELDAALLEDSAFILLEQVKLTGHLRPKVVGRMKTSEGEVSYTWTHPYTVVLPANFEAESVVYQIQPRVLYFYDNVDVKGVEVIPEDEVRRYFIPTGTLFVQKSDRAFTPNNLNDRIGRLLNQLNSLGHQDARVTNREVKMNDKTGAVQVTLEIDEGPLYKVKSYEEVIYQDDKVVEKSTHTLEDTVDNLDWLRDVRQGLSNAAYRKGFPDVKVTSEITEEGKENDGVVERDYLFKVELGEKATIRNIVFTGDPDVKDTILRRQTDLQSGELLNFLQVSEGRRKLMALGVFDEVNLSLSAPDESGQRDVIYEITPGLREQLSLLAGWGSYELARVGVHWQLNNPFHRAHRIDLEAKQSFKATSVRGTYSIPQIFGTDVTAFSQGGYLYRQEISFDREVAGISVGGTVNPDFLNGLTTGLEYGFESQRSIRFGNQSFDSRDNAIVASIKGQATLDRLDNALFPTRGYQIAGTSKTASDFLGGNVDFEKVELGAAYHHPLTDALIFHVALRYGGIFSWKEDSENIPFSERFFLGGENSVRGYKYGEAAPIDSQGELIGGQTYILGNIELEQRVVGNFALVVFYDATTISANSMVIEDGVYLDSIGAGINYQTFVGPVRLEYGYNLHRRPTDPAGTLLFSFGFPF